MAMTTKDFTMNLALSRIEKRQEVGKASEKEILLKRIVEAQREINEQLDEFYSRVISTENGYCYDVNTKTLDRALKRNLDDIISDMSGLLTRVTVANVVLKATEDPTGPVVIGEVPKDAKVCIELIKKAHAVDLSEVDKEYPLPKFLQDSIDSQITTTK